MMEKKVLKSKIWAFAKSKTLAVVLILAIATAVAADMLIQAARWQAPVPGAAGTTGKIYGYGWFQLMVLLMLLNLTACTIDGVVRRLRSGGRGAGRWGSPLFHIGLIIVITGTFLSGNYRVQGKAVLIQDETKHVPIAELTKKPLFSMQGLDRISITLRKQRIELDNWKIKNVNSLVEVAVDNNMVARRELADRQKFSYRSLYLYPGLTGYAVSLSFTGPKGEKLPDITVSMETTEFSDGVKAYKRAGFRTDILPYPLSFNFYPDLGGQGGAGIINKSGRLGSPGLFVTVLEKNAPAKQKLLRRGESLELAGYRVTFREAKPWTEMTVVYDPGGQLLFAGTMVVALGLSVLAMSKSGRSIKT